MDDSVKITKLSDTGNWPLWKFQMKVIFNSFELTSIITGEWKKPSSKITKIEKETDEEARARWHRLTIDWNRADGKCQKLIVTSVDNGPLQNLINCESAYDMWEKLLAIHEQKSEASIHLLQQKFFSYSMEATDDMSTHISKVTNLGMRLKQSGEPVTDNMVMTKILMTLPDMYNHFYSAWDSIPAVDKTINNLTSRLLIEESRLQQRNLSVMENQKSIALTANNPKKNWKSGNKNKDTRKPGNCYFCKLPGHWKSQCRKYLKNQENKKTHGETSKSDDGSAFITGTVCTNDIEESWLLDSGASDHMCGKINWFYNYVLFDEPIQVRIGDGSILLAKGKGNIKILSFANNKWNNNYLLDVLYVPELKYNLFSCCTALDKGLTLSSDKNKCMFSRNGQIVCTGERQGKLFKLEFKVITLDKEEPQANIIIKDTLQLWHERLSHQNIKYVNNILEKHNIKVSDNKNHFFCDACIIGKQHKQTFKSSTTNTTAVGEIIHADLCGPMETNSIGGSKYFLLFKDDYSHYRIVHFIKHKSEVKDLIETLIRKIKTDTGFKVKVLRTDNGLEFVNKETTSVLQKYGISHQTTVAYTPEQNGKIERENRTIVEAARTMLHTKNLNKSLWAESVNTAVYTINRTGTSSIKDKTPFEIYFRKEPEIKHLRVFGTKVFTHIPKQKRQKWDPKSEKGIFVGYVENVKGYRVWYPETNKINVSREVIFKNEIVDNEVSINENERDEIQHSISEITNGTDLDKKEELVSTYNLRNREQINKPSRYACTAFITEPINYNDAITCEQSDKWKQAMSEELDSLHKNNTWTLVSKPVGVNVINNSWVFKIKHNDRFKARLVVNGSRQQYGIDYTETFSPVVRYESIRTILAVAAAENYELRQFDIKTAFLYGNLEEDIYMSQPIGFGDSTERVCKLNRSLYGLKQSPRCWNSRFRQFLLEFNLEQSTSDSCIYFNHNNNETLILAIFVDDGLIASSSVIKTNTLLQGLEQQFEITQGNLDYFLGMEIIRYTDGSIHLHQLNYANKLISKFNLLDAKELSIPIDRSHGVEHNLTTSDNQFPYRQAVGNLLFLSQVTRPDIAFAVNYVSRFLNNPTSVHWTMVKRIIRYVKGTTNFGLYYKSNVNLCLSVYSDSDYAGDLVTRRSTSGHVFMLGLSTVSWQAQRQSIVTLSSTEAEYIAACEAVKGLVWINRLVKEINNDIEYDQPTVYVDNQSTIRLVKNPEFHKRTKHIDVRYHFIREKFEENLFKLQFIGTEEQYADILTKPLPKDRFEKLREKLSLFKLH